ncbi:glycerophosphodiester phosphodiesterase [Sinorhizobium meliloti WSM1022]|jgi:glycerophosphoryl diester phosphodiesterase|uniref:glycerophosphodiester phosphodiesterase family protein n=1 Tax=Rhizobium meliloti TaxID=382 RepID=UPI0003F52F54|nr:glycerophosphodiester phosphodiesterase family protein [Sinorhizobium meliloti]ASQ02728.1 glycerophosphodiester phosphodiesterase [Sinorhizobium meliloti]MCO6421044.1 glycerophosphodiester phosphodiesterase [Sinorhizobium meliloti]MDW9408411.1 glycerophosphodiester phosphodiesterase [Sinorhizobium meliloti]MDW9441156.1 glycerophosphodiester phosphodiesterase [Sinorhizobium meliloti]MDW9453835.1 glycerophosphodiester phosphodiesterase [Sinorhizobium meliloti]
MTKIIGHRGARNLWPENSLTGFRNALRLGVDAIEFDVHLTDSGELLVIHDATLDRTVHATGPVRRLSPEGRLATRLRVTDESIPTLSDVLGMLAARDGLHLHVEIKSDETGTPYPGIAARVAAELRRFGVDHRSHLTSFDISVLEECRLHAPHVARLVSVNADWAARQGGLSAFLPAADDLVDIVAIHHELMADEWELIRSSVPMERLCVWTLNEEAGIRRWLERGIGHLTSDSPDLALGLRDAEVASMRLEEKYSGFRPETRIF